MSFTIYNWIIEKHIVKAHELFEQNRAALKEFMAPDAFAALDSAITDGMKSEQKTAPVPQVKAAPKQPVTIDIPEEPRPSVRTPQERLAARIYQLLSEEKTQKAYDLFQKNSRKLEKSLSQAEYGSLKARVEREYAFFQKLKL